MRCDLFIPDWKPGNGNCTVHYSNLTWSRFLTLEDVIERWKKYISDYVLFVNYNKLGETSPVCCQKVPITFLDPKKAALNPQTLSQEEFVNGSEEVETEKHCLLELCLIPVAVVYLDTWKKKHETLSVKWGNIYICIYTYDHMYIYICMIICVYIYIYIMSRWICMNNRAGLSTDPTV